MFRLQCLERMILDLGVLKRFTFTLVFFCIDSEDVGVSNLECRVQNAWSIV